MKKKYFLIVSILIIFSISIFASEIIDVKDYIKGKFSTIFTIYLASLGELDEYEKEFIDLLQNLAEEEQKYFAKEVYDNGFSKEILEEIKTKDIVTKPGTEIEEKEVEKIPILNTGKWVYEKGINPINDKVVITFRLECEEDGREQPVVLTLRKEGKKTTICVNWDEYVRTVYQGMVSVKTRFGDKKAARSWNWDTSIITLGDIIKEEFFGKPAWVPSTYTFYDGRKSKFIRKLMDVDRFVIEVKSTDKTKMTAVFDVRGLKNAVEEFNDILNWIKE